MVLSNQEGLWANDTWGFGETFFKWGQLAGGNLGGQHRCFQRTISGSGCFRRRCFGGRRFRGGWRVNGRRTTTTGGDEQRDDHQQTQKSQSFHKWFSSFMSDRKLKKRPYR